MFSIAAQPFSLSWSVSPSRLYLCYGEGEGGGEGECEGECEGEGEGEGEGERVRVRVKVRVRVRWYEICLRGIVWPHLTRTVPKDLRPWHSHSLSLTLTRKPNPILNP